jgi:hypothetical protein
MAEYILVVGAVWLFHAATGGSPAIDAVLGGKVNRWVYSLLLVVLPFWSLQLAQMLWPIGGMSSYLTRLAVLTVIVFIAELVEVLSQMRNAHRWIHPLPLIVAVLSVVPIQLLVPSLPD